MIETKKLEVVESKNEKMSSKISKSIQNLYEHDNTWLNFVTIKVYPNFQNSLQILYNGLIEKLT